MTQEQWIVYLYSVWPNGGFMLLYILAFCALGIYYGILADNRSLYNSNNPDSCWYKGNAPKVKHSKLFKITPVILILLIVLSNFVPDKKEFLMLVATPYLVDGSKSLINSEKASKFSEIIDLSLDKALSELKPKEQGK